MYRRRIATSSMITAASLTIPLFAFLGAGLVSSQATAATISVPIAAVLDDLEESLENGGIDVASSDLELGTEGPPTPRQAVGLRFLDLAIPPYSVIDSANVQFMTDEADDEVTNLRIFGELSGDSPPFTADAFNITGRPRTTNSVVWSNVPVWTTEGDSGPDQQTPELSSIIQEIVDQAGWRTGNDLSIIILPEPEDDSTGERTAISFDKSGPMGSGQFNPPILNVDFTVREATADFDQDGDVDQDDFMILRGNMYAHLDREIDLLDGDLTLDRQIDLADFRQFKDQFPGAFAAAAGVPEPGTLGLLAVALMGFFVVRRRNRKDAA